MSITIKYKDKNSLEEIHSVLTNFGYTLKYDSYNDLPTTVAIFRSDKFITCLYRYQSVLIKGNGTLEVHTDLNQSSTNEEEKEKCISIKYIEVDSTSEFISRVTKEIPEAETIITANDIHVYIKENNQLVHATLGDLILTIPGYGHVVVTKNKKEIFLCRY